MNIINQKRGGLALLFSPRHISSHRIRLICQAKDLEIDYIEVDPDHLSEDLLEVNPTGRLPTLIDRDLILFNDRVVSEYLDERFPHPAFMPIEANLRAKIRLFSLEIESIWYTSVNILEHEKISRTKRKSITKELRDSVLQLAPMLKGKRYIIGTELSLLDCCVLPVLWRLSSLDIVLPDTQASQIIKQYMQYHFQKDYFKRALSKYEIGLQNVEKSIKNE